jgi:hypothetical protein
VSPVNGLIQVAHGSVYIPQSYNYLCVETMRDIERDNYIIRSALTFSTHIFHPLARMDAYLHLLFVTYAHMEVVIQMNRCIRMWEQFSVIGNYSDVVMSYVYLLI